MTPLAHALARKMVDLSTPSDERKRLRSMLDSVHYFEVTAVLPIVAQKHMTMDDVLSPSNGLLFSPGPRIWLEYKREGEREAYLLREDARGIHVAAVHSDAAAIEIIGCFDSLPDQPGYYCITKSAKYQPRMLEVGVLLSLINSPRVIGRRQIMPHRGLERELLKAQKLVGKFPLRAWTEIKLDVSKPPHLDYDELHEAHLTGRRCLHWVRAHVRDPFGEQIKVESHWRGSAALGIMQSRYVVQ